jgi:hypothetical protein
LERLLRSLRLELPLLLHLNHFALLRGELLLNRFTLMPLKNLLFMPSIK